MPRDREEPTKSRRPTLSDVAARANVSIMTVSNALGTKTGRVADETRLRVLAAIEEIGYRPMRRGRSLRMQREFAIGLIIIHPDRRFLDDPFITEIASGMSNRLADTAYSFVVKGVVDLAGLTLAMARSVNVDAYAIFASGSPDERTAAYDLLASLHLPLAILEDYAPGHLPDACALLQEDASGSAMITEVMLAAGARKIAYVAPLRIWPSTQRREAAFLAAAAGRAECDRIACEDTSFPRTHAAISRYLAEHDPPDGFMAANDTMALATVRALKDHGLDVPRDVMVAGFNAFAFREFFTPIVTSVHSQAYRLGEEAVDALIQRVETGQFETRKLILPVTLAPGDTIRPAVEPDGDTR
jgi:LacI family transcriptional regulator